MIKNFLYNYFVSRKISFKLMILTLLFSALITFFITIIQLYIDYRNGIKSINNQFSLVETGYIASINQSVWVYDKKQILLQLHGILNLPEIEYVDITLLDGEHYKLGKKIEKNFLVKKIPLTYMHNSKEIVLGELSLVGDLNKLYQQLIDKIIIVLFSQAIKTFLTSFFILFIFQRLVTRHLEHIAEYTKNVKIDIKPKVLSLNKVSSTATRDELDNLTEAINTMQGQIYKSFLNLSSELEARKKAEQSLLEYKKALDASAYVSKSDLKGIITYVNDAMCKISGYTREELIGKQHSIFRHEDTSADMFKSMWNAIKNKKIWTGEIHNVKKDGSSFYVYQTIIPIVNLSGEIVEYIASRCDITELIQSKNSLEKHYETDTLTGLGNRFKLFADIQSAKQPALAILDIDSFKEINDFYGHEVGDFVIIELSKRLLTYNCKSICKFYRLQADQFAFLDPDYSSKDSFEQMVDELLKYLTKNPVFFQKHEILLRVSAGISLDEKDLFIGADIALKMAKESKKNYVTYTKDFNVEKEYANNLEWSKKIKKAIEEERIVAFFQPIYSQHSQKIEKFEALVRMIDTDGSIISPFEFLEISKKAKLYSKITMLMINQVTKAAISHNYTFSINFTMDDILNQEVVNHFISAIDENKIGDKIVIELVESEGIENFAEFSSFVEKVKQYGCRLAIDDFGTGYSNFEYLLKLDVDYLKIDGSLIKNIDKNNHLRLVVETIVAFAKTAKVQTIAEFVSDEAIANIAQEIGIDYFQGYYFGKPTAYENLQKIADGIVYE